MFRLVLLLFSFSRASCVFYASCALRSVSLSGLHGLLSAASPFLFPASFNLSRASFPALLLTRSASPLTSPVPGFIQLTGQRPDRFRFRHSAVSRSLPHSFSRQGGVYRFTAYSVLRRVGLWPGMFRNRAPAPPALYLVAPLRAAALFPLFSLRPSPFRLRSSSRGLSSRCPLVPRPLHLPLLLRRKALRIPRGFASPCHLLCYCVACATCVTCVACAVRTYRLRPSLFRLRSPSRGLSFLYPLVPRPLHLPLPLRRKALRIPRGFASPFHLSCYGYRFTPGFRDLPIRISSPDRPVVLLRLRAAFLKRKGRANSRPFPEKTTYLTVAESLFDLHATAYDLVPFGYGYGFDRKGVTGELNRVGVVLAGFPTSTIIRNSERQSVTHGSASHRII